MNSTTTTNVTRSKPNIRSYPWCQKNLNLLNPFSRYDFSMSDRSINDELFVFGGLTQENATNDLYSIDITTLNVNLLTASGEIPKKYRHTQFIYENNIIVFGGVSENPENKSDGNIYLLNTFSRAWSKYTVNGNSPDNLVGYASTIIGSTIYVFGGQNLGNYFNELMCLNLKSLKLRRKRSKLKFSLGRSRANSVVLRWEVVNSVNKGPSSRSGHSACAYDNKIYIFGGTDGRKCFNDIWSFNVETGIWTELSCIGYFPEPRERHAAILVDDVLYVFGGKTQENEELGDLAAFRIANQRWYRFPQMGPSPSPRYGLAMSAINDKIYVFGGDSQKIPKPGSDGCIHILDTSGVPPILMQRDTNSPRQSIESTRSTRSDSTASRISIAGPQVDTEKSQEQQQKLSSSHKISFDFRSNKAKPNLVIKVPSITEFTKHIDEKSLPPTVILQDNSIQENINPSKEINNNINISNSEFVDSTDDFEDSEEHEQDITQEVFVSKRDSLLNTIIEESEEEEIYEESEDEEESVIYEEPDDEYEEPEYEEYEERPENEEEEENINSEVQSLRESSNGTDTFYTISQAESEIINNLEDENNLEENDFEEVVSNNFEEDDDQMDEYIRNDLIERKVNKKPISPRDYRRPNSQLSHYDIQPLESKTYLARRREMNNRLSDVNINIVPSISTPDKESFMMSASESTESDTSNESNMRPKLHAELDLAKKSGYTSNLVRGENSFEDVDIEVLMKDMGEPGSEKYKVMQSIIRMKKELVKAKETIAIQAQIASEKMSIAEKERTAALKEVSLYKKKLDELKSTTTNTEGIINSQEMQKTANLESQLSRVLKENKLLSNQLLKYYKKNEKERTKAMASKEKENFENIRMEISSKSREQMLPKLQVLRDRVSNSELKLEESNCNLTKVNSELQKSKENSKESQVELKNLKGSLESHYILFQQINNSINFTNEKTDKLEKLLKRLRNDKLQYETEIAELKIELELKSNEVKLIEDKLEEMETLLENIQNEGRILRLMLQESIKDLFKFSQEKKIKSGENDDDEKVENIENIWQLMKIKQLEEELKYLKNLQNEKTDVYI
ncbi:5924_t:CDS:10 [Diversispora eburnea]|uniref:5924_t:CDS:1 n=1 Tax=Diversispora eburnea TaxID=1213867 RepID=A0A9N8VLI0_9GLOM|nr:5924_t:CDS:10 [Diversispora eburnea]